MQNVLTVVDLFCGAGGFSEGFKKAGYKILAGFDIDMAASKTYKEAHPNSIFFADPIEQLNPVHVRKKLGLKKGDLSCMIGGPPCQAYSINNHNRGFHDSRAKLFRAYIRFVEEFYPKWVIIENVTGILSAGGGKAITEITKKLALLGYKAELKVLKAEEYGVPQSRRRVFVLATRMRNQIDWPKPFFFGDKDQFTSIKDAIYDLPPLHNGGGAPTAKYTKKPSSNYQHEMRKKCLHLFNHETNSLSDLNMQRIQYVSQGGSWRDIPRRYLPTGMKRARRCDHTKRYGRLHPDGLASTILTKCDIHWGCFVHPTQDRVISVREAARLQSFPDNYKFCGSRTEQYMQVGNAVPPLVAFAIAKTIKKSLVKKHVNVQLGEIEI